MGVAGSYLKYSVSKFKSQNGIDHHTDRYDLMARTDSKSRLVVRRGQLFSLRFQFEQTYNTSHFHINVKFILDGIEMAESDKGTIIQNNTGGAPKDWGISMEPIPVNAYLVKIYSPTTAAIGRWKLTVQIKMLTTTAFFYMNEEFDLLYNPWSPDDVVYINNEAARQEYVMSDRAMIWTGSYDYMSPLLWFYSQFDADILDCTYHLLFNVARIPLSSRQDPALVARALCAYINNQTGKGILIGNWSNDYSGGTPPTNWLGSRDIIQRYYATKQAVKYGQCWVYAGLFTTVLRALGIPSRAITTFAAAHDTNLSLSVDVFVAAATKPGLNPAKCNNEFVWNFHVWNEIWSRREDLEDPDYRNFVGWQAVDSTPPLQSTAIHQRGPAPLIAVKNGKLGEDHDCTYIFAEVNADEVFWTWFGDNEAPVFNRANTERFVFPFTPYRIDNIVVKYCSIGQNISTQAIGSIEREDITYLYKYPENSNEAFIAMDTARTVHSFEPKIPHACLKMATFNPVNFDFQMPQNIIIGSPFSVLLKMTNNDTVEHTITITLHVETAHYTHRARGEEVKSAMLKKLVKPDAIETAVLNVDWIDYQSKAQNHCLFNISCHAKVLETQFEFVRCKPFQLKKPEIIIKKKTDAVIGKPLKAKASLINPLAIPLTNGTFLVEGPGLNSQLKIKLTGHVQPGKKVSCDFAMLPKFDGSAAIAVKFYSRELNDVNGHLIFPVQKMENNTSGCPLS